MNQEFIMMFNGDDAVRLSGDTGNEVTEGVIAALYNEMQQSMQSEADARQIVVVDDAQNIVASNFAPFKDDSFKVDNTNLMTDDLQHSVGVTSNGVNEENMIIMDDGVAVSLADENSLKGKNMEIPDSWKIGLLESNGIVPHNTEPLIDMDKQTCQLWECPKCSALFRDKESCEQHVVKSHDFTCGLCSEPFQEKEQLESHIIQHISEIPGHAIQLIAPTSEKASEINDNSDTQQLLDSNAQQVLDQADSKDNVAEVSNNESVPIRAKNESENIVAAVGVAQEEPSDLFVCSTCGLSFSSKQNLEEHDETHVDEESSFQSHEVGSSTPAVELATAEESESSSKGHQQFVCEVCEKCFYTKNSLLLHVNKRHSDSTNFTCKECGQCFRWKLSLENHLVIQHNHKKKSFLCSVCNEVCSSAESLTTHLSSHEQENDTFSCDTCEAKFKQSANLLTHIKTNHPNGQRFPCEECGKSFKIKKFLEAHKSEVHGMRCGNKCRYCLKAFMSSDALTNHIRTHHTSKQDKQYNCEICSSSFVSSRDLNEHISVHTEEKHLECHVCAKSFSLEGNLKMHMKTHVGVSHHSMMDET